MRFNCGLTYHEKDALKRKWHKRFAFFPTRICVYKNGAWRSTKYGCCWLETIERRKVGSTWDGYEVFEYRPLKK